MPISTPLFGILAGFTHLIAYAVYNRKTFIGEMKPNAATWSIGVFLSISMFLSYLIMTGDSVKAIQSGVGVAGSLGVFLMAITRRRFARVTAWEITALIIGMTAIAAWWLSESAMVANLVLQLVLIATFLPMLRGLWREPSREHPLPWLLFSAAYLLNILNVIARWRGQPEDLIFPIHACILHAAVSIMSARKPREGTPSKQTVF